MSEQRTVVMELTRIEAAHLAGLVTQFAELLEDTAGAREPDPAVLRLVPDAYADDPAAAREFRELTEKDLLGRRREDAGIVLGTLATVGALDEDADAMEVVVIVLDAETAPSWMRTLAAIRLVLATRLGIRSEDDHDHDDPRFGIYDWLGFRLDGLVTALEG